MALTIHRFNSGSLARFKRDDQPHGVAVRLLVLRNAYDTICLQIDNPHVSDAQIAALVDQINDLLNTCPAEAANADA